MKKKIIDESMVLRRAIVQDKETGELNDNVLGKNSSIIKQDGFISTKFDNINTAAYQPNIDNTTTPPKKTTGNHIKIGEFIDKMKWFNEVMSRDLNMLTTGNLAHHKSAMTSYLNELMRFYSTLEPVLKELELQELDKTLSLSQKYIDGIPVKDVMLFIETVKQHTKK